MSFPDQDEDGFGPDDVMRLTGVSRETFSRVRAYLDLLDVWRTRINLIGPSEGRHLWKRHVYDSLQVLDLIGPGVKTIADLGSGAGFPGIVLACALADRADFSVTLVEKSVRKAEFLQAAVDAVRLPAVVRNQRIEDSHPVRVDLVTARALAPLPKLLALAEGWMRPGGQAVFLKGREAASELTLARESWTFDISARASMSSPDGQVLAISSLKRRAK